jgi:L-asparaginase type II
MRVLTGLFAVLIVSLHTSEPLAAQAGARTSEPTRTGAAQDSAVRPTVLVIATGGTIAGVQSAPGTMGGYRAGTLTAEQVISSVPELARHARVEAEQFSNVASTRITPAQWVALARRIETVLRERPELAGVVVTHGTDRLEETAFFLYLTVRSDKPVVVVGSQRPATGISPDGPINLLAAVRTAASPHAVGKGVMVVMDDRILSAREVRKQYQRVGGFTVGEMGMLGVVASDGPEFFYTPARRHGASSEFDVSNVDSLPRVELLFSYPGGTGPRFDTLPAGVVVATTGFAPDEGAPFRTLRQKGVVVVTAFPSGDNVNGAPRQNAPQNDSTAGDSARSDSARADTSAAAATARSERAVPPSVVSQHLTPQKARILLMLALTKTRDPRELQRYFLAY